MPTTCTASGGSFTGSGTSGTASVTLSATTTYTMTCTGTGGSGTQSVTVTATAAPSKSGGGAIDPAVLIVGSGVIGRANAPPAPLKNPSGGCSRPAKSKFDALTCRALRAILAR